MNKIYFVTGSQDLYGGETLAQAARDSAKMADFLNEKLSDIAEVVFQPVVKTADEAEDICVRASSDKECIGVIMWMHTFSPAKMWIRALKALKKPMLHLHTQFNEKLPYDSIDMDFMNLNLRTATASSGSSAQGSALSARSLQATISTRTL